MKVIITSSKCLNDTLLVIQNRSVTLQNSRHPPAAVMQRAPSCIQYKFNHENRNSILSFYADSMSLADF